MGLIQTRKTLQASPKARNQKRYISVWLRDSPNATNARTVSMTLANFWLRSLPSTANSSQ